MTLIEIVERLKKEDPNRAVPLGWDEAMSWRGDYYQLAVNPAKSVTVGAMIKVLEDAVGETFEGYKGGEFVMGKYTDVYLDQYGRSDGNRISYYLLEFMLGNTPEPLED